MVRQQYDERAERRELIVEFITREIVSPIHTFAYNTRSTCRNDPEKRTQVLINLEPDTTQTHRFVFYRHR